MIIRSKHLLKIDTKHLNILAIATFIAAFMALIAVVYAMHVNFIR